LSGGSVGDFCPFRNGCSLFLLAFSIPQRGTPRVGHQSIAERLDP
jgi:hypothetical protein